MDNVTASIIIACQTAGAVTSINKLGFMLSMLGREAIAFGQESIQVFSDLQEETQKFGTVFAGVQNQANDSVRQLMEEFGQSELSARRMMAQTGDLLKGTGISQQDIAAISAEVSKLGSDLTSFANYSGGAENSTFALTKAMLGETEMAKSLGVFIKTDTEEFKKLEKQARTTGIYIEHFGRTFKASTTVQARVFASLATMFDQKGYVLGDYLRNITSIANQSRKLENSTTELKATVGGFLNQIIGVGAIKGGMAETINKITEIIKTNGNEWAYYIATFVNVARTGFDYVWQGASVSLKNIYTIGKFAYETIVQIWKDAPGFFGAVWEDIKTVADNTFDYIVVSFKSSFVFWSEVLQSFLSNWTGIFTDMWEVGKRTIKSIVSFFVEAIKGIGGVASSFGENFWDLITGKKKFSEAAGGVVDSYMKVLNAAGEKIGAAWEDFEFGSGTRKFGDDVAAAFQKMAKTRADAGGKIFSESLKNTMAYLEKNGIVMGELTNPWSLLGGLYDDFMRRQSEIESRRGTRYEAPVDDIVAQNTASLVRELSGTLNRIQQTSQNSIFANSLESARLQSRMLLGPTGISLSNNPQKTTAEQSKRQTALLQDLRTRMDTIINGLDQIATQTV